MNRPRILGPVMIPDIKMLRYHDDIGFYELLFSVETIEHYRSKFHKNKKEKSINLKHSSSPYSGAILTDSFLINPNNSRTLPQEFEDLPDGTWMLEYAFATIDSYEQVVKSNLKGFSIEGKFTIKGENGKTYKISEAFRIMNKLSDFLPFNIYVQGGSTYGAGKNEHGEAHFELKEKNSGTPIGKIFMPTKEVWLKSAFSERVPLMKVQNGKDIPKKQKKAMVRWLELNDNENLFRCHLEWNKSNRDNNRVTLI